MITNSNQIELRHLRYFRELAKELHFHRAADKLFISQPGLSRQIQQLETFLGYPLFIRDKKRVELTTAGDFFQKEVEFILNQVAGAIEQTQIIASGAGGNVRIGFVGSAMHNVIPEIVNKSSEEHPEISFSFEEMRNAVQVEHVEQGAIDIGFVRLNEVPEDLVLRKIFQDTFSLVLPSNHPITQDSFCDMSQFANETYILFQPRYSPAYYDEVLSICEDAGFTPKVTHNSVHASTIYRLVESGFGISIVPTSLQEGYDMKVKFIELKDIRQQAELSIVYSKKNRNPSLKHILKIIDTSFQ